MTQVAAETRKDITVVTGANFDAYVSQEMGKNAPAETGTDNDSADNAGGAKGAGKQSADAKAADDKKAGAVSEEADLESEVGDHPKKDGINERFAKVTAARKAAEEAALKASDEAKAAREARDQAEREAAELRAKYEPPKSDELGPKPERAQFASDQDFEAALTDWAGDKALRERDAKAAEERAKKEQAETAKAWGERQEAFVKETPDYREVIDKSDVKVSDQVRDAIVESEVGPKILYHLAQNPEVATKIGAMTVARALREIGKLEVSLSGPAKEVKAEAKTGIAEISKAPAPISPLRNASAPIVSLKGSDKVPANMTYEDWKKQRQAGKIQ